MKKVFNSLFVIIAAMVTFAGCAKQEIDAPATPETKTVQFFANSIETKTAFGTPDGTTYPTLWTANDEKVHVSMNLTSSSAYDITPSDDFKTARFEATIIDDETGSYTFYSVSPASANIQFSSSYKSYNLEIPTTQNPSATSVDERAQLLVAKSQKYTEFPASVNLNYTHFTAYGKVSFENLDLGEDNEVISVALTASEPFAYRYYYYPETGKFSANGATETITINTTSTTDIWFACAPVDLSGKTMNVVVNTKNGTFKKEITFTKGGNFESGKIAKFTIDMAGKSLESSDTYELVTNPFDLSEGSKVIIVGDEYAMSTNQKSSNRGASAITLSDDKSTVSTPGADVQIFTVEPGTKTGTIAFNTGSGYIYAASSSGNQLKTKTDLDANASWMVSITGGVTSIVAQGTNTRNVMQYNPNNGSPLFACYAPDKPQKNVSIYKLQGSGTVKENYLDVPATIEVEATATAAQISVKSDLAWTASASAGATLDKVSATGNADVNVTFSANTLSETKTYTVTFTADGIEKVVTITQAAVEPETPVFASLADLIATIQPTTTATKVTVTLTDEEITGIYTTSSGYKNGIFLMVGDREIEIFSRNVPETWEVGGTVSGTLTECDWKLYGTTWELCPANWSELTYTAPAGGSTDPTPDPEQPGDVVNKTATFNFKQIYADNGGTTSNITVGDITFVGEKGTASTPARAWSDGLRLYAGCKVTFKAADGYVITSISGDNSLSFTGSQQTVEFSNLAKKTISADIVVTYKTN